MLSTSLSFKQKLERTELYIRLVEHSKTNFANLFVHNIFIVFSGYSYNFIMQY